MFIDAEGLSDLKTYVEISPQKAAKAARIAINQTAERTGLKLAREAMLKQVAFPRGYFNEIDRSGDKRFALQYRATDTRLSAGIVGRQEPTQLSRFVRERPAFVRAVSGRGRRLRRGHPLHITVQPGHLTTTERAFFIRLKSGNIGLGIRLRNNETLTNTTGAKVITSGPLRGVALLYGPSVDQVFRTVAVDISPPILNALTVEFLRQWELQHRNANIPTA